MHATNQDALVKIAVVMGQKKDHLVLLSGGLASFEAARRVVQRYGRDQVRLWFFDTLIEDEDLYRFLSDIEKHLEIPIRRLCDGRNPWQVFRHERFIGNSQADVCSKHLKRTLLERELRSSYPNKSDVVLYFGLEWSEPHRIQALKPKWEQKGYAVDFPLAWEPWLFPQDYRTIVEQAGMILPRLYDLGFPHNNCGGACVKAGMGQWTLLYKTFPDRYKWHEEMEHELRIFLRKNVSILRSRKRGKTRPYTLRNLRLRIDQGVTDVSCAEPSSGSEEAACSCFFNFSEI